MDPSLTRLSSQQGCQHCSLNKLCIPLAVSGEEMDRLDEVVRRGQIFDKGKRVFNQHETFTSCYAVRSGAIKTFTLSEEGEEQVTGFYLPGEVIGLDSVSTESYACSAVALERTSVCEIPLEQFEHLALEIPSLQHHFFALMSKEIQESRQLTTLLSKNTAEERIAALLLSLSGRFKRRRLSETAFRLPMPRSDIANYLGLAVETVSRVLTRFQNQGLLTISGREVRLQNMEALSQLVRHDGSCRALKSAGL